MCVRYNWACSCWGGLDGGSWNLRVWDKVTGQSDGGITVESGDIGLDIVFLFLSMLCWVALGDIPEPFLLCMLGGVFQTTLVTPSQAV